MRLMVIEGDGIGPEIVRATMEVVRAAADRHGIALDVSGEVVGHACLKEHGVTYRPGMVERVHAADGLILGPVSLSDFRGEAFGEASPSMILRRELELYANIRPTRTYKGLPVKFDDFDIVIVRENTEGFYADRNMFVGNADLLVTPDVAVALRRVTRQRCEQIAHEGFRLAQKRKKHVTLVHKFNVLKNGDGLFLSVCREVAKQYPDVKVDDVLVDAMVALLIRDPARFDVVVTTNMFGDILSDLTAEMSGSLGLGGSINAGEEDAMAQASHGSAPDIAGKNIANPLSLILSAALLFTWYGTRKNDAACLEAGRSIETAVEEAIAAGEKTADIGGKLGTAEAGAAVAKRIRG